MTKREKFIEDLKAIIEDNEKTIARYDRRGLSADVKYWEGVRDGHKDIVRALELMT